MWSYFSVSLNISLVKKIALFKLEYVTQITCELTLFSQRNWIFLNSILCSLRVAIKLDIYDATS